MLHNIQLLRAIAAMLVVMQHSFSRGEFYGLPARDLLFLDGFGLSGVDIFFVISGFIMSYSQDRNAKTPRAFAPGRFVRIAQLYWAWMSVLALARLMLPGLSSTLQFDAAHFGWSLLFLSQPAHGTEPFLDVGWTLEYEMLLYAALALTLAMTAFALLAQNYIVFEFLMGVDAFHLRGLFDLRGVAVAALALGVVGVAFDIAFDPDVNRVWRWGVPAFLIVSGAAALPDRQFRISAFLGNAVYSIYLVQVATISVFYKVMQVVCGSMPVENTGGGRAFA